MGFNSAFKGLKVKCYKKSEGLRPDDPKAQSGGSSSGHFLNQLSGYIPAEILRNVGRLLLQ